MESNVTTSFQVPLFLFIIVFYAYENDALLWQDDQKMSASRVVKVYSVKAPIVTSSSIHTVMKSVKF